MKKNIFTTLLAFAALVLTSCSMINNTEPENNSESFIKLGITENNRTALPEVSIVQEFTSLTLTATTATENATTVPETTWITDENQSAYEKMTAANIAVTQGASYSFTLTGKKGGGIWQGTASKTIEQGANALSFTLKLKTISPEGTGGINVTLTVPSEVIAVEAAFKTLDESNTLTPEGADFTFENNKATYTASGITAGNYVIIFKLFGDAAKNHEIAQWREYAQIADGITSTSNPVIESADKLKSIYTVTFDSKGGSTVTAKTVTGGKTITNPETPTRESSPTTNYTFAGWYTSTDDGTTLSASAFNFLTTAINTPLTLYAKWTESTRTYNISFNANGGTITTSSQTVNAGFTTALTSASSLGLSYSDVNYSFGGWNTAANGSGTTYADGTSVTITAPLTLYAQWEPNPLTLEAIVAGNITIKMEGKTNNTATTTAPWSTLKYRKNGGALTAVTADSSTNITTIQVAAGDKICLFAVESENTYTDNQNYSYMNISCDADCYIYGNVMSLVSLNESTGTWNKDAATVSENAFRQLFSKNTYIKNHPSKTLKLPATTLAKNCYCDMFNSCSSLTTAPALPATTLAENCYSGMFLSCSNLTSAPELPATTLAKNCYLSMFRYSGLTSAPALPATTLAMGCYEMMFAGCKNISSAPALPATTLAEECYNQMFYECTSLTTASSLPATTVAKKCYYRMFYGCTSLTKAPSNLPAKTLAENCYDNMFRGCTSLQAAPALPATNLAEKCYYQMFYKCTGLTNAPTILPATTLTNNCYGSMFQACTSLKTAPELPATTLTENCYYCMFYQCTNLNYIKCLATDISANQCTDSWVRQIASSGTFVKSGNTDWSSKGKFDGIPSGWTVQNQ